ncbi:MAG TPA: cytochrome d ubiquinol oxidase subunit II, partial [Planctomycetota bacterium]|nr:cytochrome d ubiquinol oxidase subunit II [Planctomycetota bacterium]
SVLGILNIGRSIHQNKPFQAFASSTVTIVSIVFLFCVSMFPNLVPASNHGGRSLDVLNAASSEPSLWMMFWIAIAGMPFVLGYTAIVYWTFRGRTKIEEHSY